jgi:hypothetical protein
MRPIEVARMKVELCHHVKEDGISCHSPALRGRGYCFFHLRYKGYPLRTWRNRHRIGGWRFKPSMAHNLKAVEASLKRVEIALSSGNCVDPERARIIRYGLRLMAADLRRQQHQPSRDQDTKITIKQKGAPK